MRSSTFREQLIYSGAMESPSTTPPRLPTPAAGLALFFGVVALHATAAMTLPEEIVLFAIPVSMLLATVAAILIFRVDAKQTLLLRLPSATDFLMAIPLAISVFILDDQIAGISHARFPVPEQTQDFLRTFLTVTTPWDWVKKIGLIGVGAAVSEELMFRGFLQTAFASRLRRSAAILLTALLFMVLHAQFLPVLAAGIILGFVAMATRSIVIPMFVHFANNVTQLLLFNLAGLETLGDPIWIPPTILLPAIVMFALTWGYYMRRLGSEPEPDEPEPDPNNDLRSSRREPIAIHHTPAPLSQELAQLSASRRRLGWLVVAGAVLIGVVVLFALFAWSVYFVDPQNAHSRGLAVLEEQITAELEPDAQAKQPQIESAFQALSILNDTGQMQWRDLASVAASYRELGADGSLDARDADAIVATIRDLVRQRTRARAL